MVPFFKTVLRAKQKLTKRQKIKGEITVIIMAPYHRLSTPRFLATDFVFDKVCDSICAK